MNDRSESVIASKKYHIAVVGDGAVGKSALTIRMVMGKFVTAYDPTIEDSYQKMVRVDEESAMLEILDTAGQEDYSPFLGDSYMRTKDGFLVLYSITTQQSLTKAKALLERIASVREGEDIPMVLVGNKSDLEDERVVFFAEGEAAAAEHKVPFIETSACTGSNVQESFDTLVREIRKWRKARGIGVEEGETSKTDDKKKKKKKRLCTIL